MAGLAEPATTIYPQAYWAHDPSLGKILAYDPDKARALIKEVGGEEYNDLRKILKTLGVPTSELSAELEQSQIEWRV